MDRQTRITGLFWGIAIGVAFLIHVIVLASSPDHSVKAEFLLPRTYILLASVALLLASAYAKRFAWIQPVVMFALTPVSFTADPLSFYGLSFFFVGVITLFRLGFFARLRGLKLALCTLYLLGCELLVLERSGLGLLEAIDPVFFMIVFVAFMCLAYEEKLAVFLHEPKPLLSLRAQGLSAAERVYVMAIVEGRSPKEVASECSVSESTVRNTLARAYKKLGVEDKSALAALAENHRISD